MDVVPPVLIRGDARHLPLADASVDLIVTSPPYYGLRSYTDDGGTPYAGQIGAEATPDEYIDSLIASTREWMRVLKPAGSLWVNLGDKYSTGNSGESRLAKLGKQYRGGGHSDAKAKTGSRRFDDMPTKSLLGLPWRYAIRCVDDLRLILRAEVIWSKPNGLPESVTDRVRRSHEQWFHFTLRPRYYSAVDAIRMRHTSDVTPGRRYYGAAFGQMKNGGGDGSRHTDGHPLGRLPGSVWEVATQPLIVPAQLGIDHYAAYPMELPRRLVLGWSPREVCTACGEGRRPVTQVSRVDRRPSRHVEYGAGRHGASARSRLDTTPAARIFGYVCACAGTAVPAQPGVVLDPFGGTGTTALVASVLGRRGISVDASGDYCRLARWRCGDPAERAKAAQTDRPPAEIPGQIDLFEGASSRPG